MKETQIEELAHRWLKFNYFHRDKVEILPFQTSTGLVVYFYDKDSGEDFDWFLTIPMVKELQEGKSPKKVRNNYLPRTENMTSGEIRRIKVAGLPVKHEYAVERDKIWIDPVDWVKKHKNRKPNNSAQKLRIKVFKRDGNKCLKCGSILNLTIDHIKPKSKGGRNTESNYQTLCNDCNGEKGSTEIDYRPRARN